MTQHAYAYDEEIIAFNQSQAQKIVDIKKKRMEREDAKRQSFEQFKSLLFSIAIIVVLACIFGVMIYQSSIVSEAKYDIFNLKSQINSLDARIMELEEKIEVQTSLENVKKIAMERLQLQPLRQEQIVYVNNPILLDYTALLNQDSEDEALEAFNNR